MVLTSERLTLYIAACKFLKLKRERVLEMQYNPEIVRMMADAMEVCTDRIGFTGKTEELGDAFIISLNAEVMNRITDGAHTISKGELFDCVLESLEQHRQYYKRIAGKESKETRKFYASLDELKKKLNQRDPIVHYQGRTMRYSKFMILDRKPCFVNPIDDGEKLAVDAAELQAKLYAAKINIKVQDLEVRNSFPIKRVDLAMDRKISFIIASMEAQSKLDLEKLAEKKKKRNQFNRDRKKRNKKAQTGGAEGASADAHGEGPSTSTDA